MVEQLGDGRCGALLPELDRHFWSRFDNPRAAAGGEPISVGSAVFLALAGAASSAADRSGFTS